MKSGGMKSGGCWSIAIGALVSVALGVGGAMYQKHLAHESEKRQDALLDKQERKAKVMHLKEYNQALAAYNAGTLIAERDILQAKRERRAEENGYNTGSPVRS